MTGTEDCLNLAVFTPFTTATTVINHQRLLPVIVFIHGGGFSRGSYTALGGNYLLDHDVVLVNIHYRLAALGFLCLNTSQSRTNVGLLDQLLALQWVSFTSEAHTSLTSVTPQVQDHIRWFGGDPGQVTVVGESAVSSQPPRPAKILHRAADPAPQQSGAALEPCLQAHDRSLASAGDVLGGD